MRPARFYSEEVLTLGATATCVNALSMKNSFVYPIMTVYTRPAGRLARSIIHVVRCEVWHGSRESRQRYDEFDHSGGGVVVSWRTHRSRESLRIRCPNCSISDTCSLRTSPEIQNMLFCTEYTITLIFFEKRHVQCLTCLKIASINT